MIEILSVKILFIIFIAFDAHITESLQVIKHFLRCLRGCQHSAGAHNIPAGKLLQPLPADGVGHAEAVDHGSQHPHLIRRDGVLMVYKGETEIETDCTMTCARLQLLALMNGKTEVAANMNIEGDETVPARMVKYMTPINRNFNIIEP